MGRGVEQSKTMYSPLYGQHPVRQSVRHALADQEQVRVQQLIDRLAREEISAWEVLDELHRLGRERAVQDPYQQLLDAFSLWTARYALEEQDGLRALCGQLGRNDTEAVIDGWLNSERTAVSRGVAARLGQQTGTREFVETLASLIYSQSAYMVASETLAAGGAASVLAILGDHTLILRDRPAPALDAGEWRIACSNTWVRGNGQHALASTRRELIEYLARRAPDAKGQEATASVV